MSKMFRISAYSGNSINVDVASFIERASEGYIDVYSGGQIEQLQQRVTNQSEFLGRLVECLVEKDLLTHEDILNLSWGMDATIVEDET